MKYDIVVNINYQLNVPETWGKTISKSRTVSIKAYSSSEISESWGGMGFCFIGENPIDYVVVEPAVLVPKKDIVTKNMTICKQCLGKNCTNDGDSCTKPTECGGGFCVEGYCSNSKKCFNNDCKCSQDEIQCEDNMRCVKRMSLDVGSKPICSFEECNTKYINPNTGLCAKSPEQIAQEEKDTLKKEQETQQQLQKEAEDRRQQMLREEQEGRDQLLNQLFFGGTILVILFVFVFIIRSKDQKEKQRTIIEMEEAKQKTIEKEKEKEKERQKTMQKEIESISLEIQKIDKLRNSQKVTESELAELDKKKEELRLKKEEFEKNNNEFLTKEAIDKYEQRYHKKVDLDEKSGYFRFKSNNELLHIYLYKNHFRLEKGFEVHHIDADKKNNELWNLIALPTNEHFRFKHAKIIFRNWNSGIKELQEQLGMKEEDFHEHIQKHMKEVGFTALA